MNAPKLAELLASDQTETVEQAFRRGMRICSACRDDLEAVFMDYNPMPPWAYALACEKHVAHFRALQDPAWLAWLHKKMQTKKEAQDMLARVLDIYERIDKGVLLLREPNLTDQQLNAYNGRLYRLRQSIPTAYRGKTVSEIQQLVDKCEEEVIYYENTIRRAVSWEET